MFWVFEKENEQLDENAFQNIPSSLYYVAIFLAGEWGEVKEQNEENLMRGRKIFEPPRFMTCAQASAAPLRPLTWQMVADRGVVARFAITAGRASSATASRIRSQLDDSEDDRATACAWPIAATAAAA